MRSIDWHKPRRRHAGELVCLTVPGSRLVRKVVVSKRRAAGDAAFESSHALHVRQLMHLTTHSYRTVAEVETCHGFASLQLASIPFGTCCRFDIS